MRIVVGVLRGGPQEYDLSLKTGAEMLAALNREKYEPRDIFIDKNGIWHNRGIAASVEKALTGADVVLSALHGQIGQEGSLQSVLDPLAVPYAGSPRLSSTLSYSRPLSRTKILGLGLKVPHAQIIEVQEPELQARELFRSFPHPALVRPLFGSDPSQARFADTYHKLEEALRDAPYAQMLIEEYIPGRRATVGLIDDFRGEKTYAMIPSPIDLSRSHKDELSEVSKKLHETLELRHFSEAEFVVGKRGVYFLHLNAYPKLHQESSFRRGLDAIGASLSNFLDHLISLARKR